MEKNTSCNKARAVVMKWCEISQSPGARINSWCNIQISKKKEGELGSRRRSVDGTGISQHHFCKFPVTLVPIISGSREHVFNRNKGIGTWKVYYTRCWCNWLSFLLSQASCLFRFWFTLRSRDFGFTVLLFLFSLRFTSIMLVSVLEKNKRFYLSFWKVTLSFLWWK